MSIKIFFVIVLEVIVVAVEVIIINNITDYKLTVFDRIDSIRKLCCVVESKACKLFFFALVCWALVNIDSTDGILAEVDCFGLNIFEDV